ncbi:MAG: phosphodiester glycosidase family protein [Actinomycetota bacterium]|nr:phosphodiester glycosidase family protein [Actinomycetota bacterium]
MIRRGSARGVAPVEATSTATSTAPSTTTSPSSLAGLFSVLVAMVCVASLTLTPLAGSVAGASGSQPRARAAGLRLFTINGRFAGVATAVHVLSVSGPHYRVRIALARHALDAGVQTPRAMCESTPHCVAAVNGDYFDLTRPGWADPGDEVGGIIVNCVLEHTPEISHQQADLDSHTVTQGLDWSDTVNVDGSQVAISAINQQLPIAYNQVHLALSGTLLYTSPYSLRVPARPGRITDVFVHVAGLASVTRINTTARLELVARTKRSLKVAQGRVYISTPRDSLLSSLRVGETITTTTRSTAGCDNIGGHPILLNHGVVVPVAPADTYMVKPYARTVIGWTASGRTIIMTVDGKDGVSGATATQLVALLQSLDVVTALDLDGGNSTTFYAKGRTLNHPSQGAERPVSTGVVVVESARAQTAPR